MILVSGRVLLFFSHRLRLPIVIMFRLFYFLLTNIWAIVGVIFYIKANEQNSLTQVYKSIIIISIIFCFVISFVLRRGSLRIPYRQTERQRLLVANDPERNYNILNDWTIKYPKTEKNDCTVCCEEFIHKKKVVKLPNCGHYFHKACIEEWVKVKPICPNCKGDLTNFFNVGWMN
jgi:hypothetical protein